jgi:hypothetical protein
VALEDVVPVVFSGPEALDSRMNGDHGLGHLLADCIGVEAAVDPTALIQETGQPAWVWPGAGGRDAIVVLVESEAADGVDGRLDQDESGPGVGGDGKEARVLSRTRS